MTELQGYIIPAFLVFCRVGVCFMVLPGFSSERVPIRVRLFLAIAVSLALAPLIVPEITERRWEAGVAELFLAILKEMMVGFLMGFVIRVFIAALQFMGTAIALYIGLGTLPGIGTSESVPVPAVASLIGALATVMFFVLELHVEVIRALYATYSVIPVGLGVSPQVGLDKLTDALATSFLLVVQISGPFLVYGLMVNLLFGLVNKMVPQVPAYFVSLPFLIMGGLVLLYFVLDDMFDVFFNVFSRFISEV